MSTEQKLPTLDDLAQSTGRLRERVGVMGDYL